VDRGEVAADRAAELDERVDAAALRPGEPPVEQRDACRAAQLECLPELFLEQVRLMPTSA
jgi:hypothetical protein